MSRVPADDPALHLAAAFCNTRDVLADPPDQLTVRVARRLVEQYGFPDLAGRLPATERAAALAALRTVRERLYQVFAAGSAEAKVAAVNDLLAAHAAVARVVTDPDGGLRLGASGGRGPVGRLAVLLAGAVGRVLAEGGADRLRTCLADPCRCGYVDRTRAGGRRYCCQLCNDRVASAAYRRRQG